MRRLVVCLRASKSRAVYAGGVEMRVLSGGFLVAVMFFAGCAGGQSGTFSPSSAAAPSQSDVAAPSPAAPASSVNATPGGSPSAYKSTQFQVPFTIELPGGWTVAERGPDVAQIYQQCSTCAHSGEENGEISLDLTYADKSVDEALADLLKADNIKASDVGKGQLGGLSGAKFTATRTGQGEPSFGTTDYHSEPAGLPIDVYVVTVAGKTATVFVDPHEASGDAAERFIESALHVLGSFREGA